MRDMVRWIKDYREKTGCDLRTAKSIWDVSQRGLPSDQSSQREPETLRDRFAMAALTGMLAAENSIRGEPGYQPEWAAERSYLIADAMLVARGKEECPTTSTSMQFPAEQI